MKTKLVLLFVSSVLTLFVSEMGLRLIGGFTSKEVRTVSEEHYDKIPGMWEPNQSLVSMSIPELPHQVSINSFGFRGAEPEASWSQQYKILFVGDSFTFGSYVNDDQSLPSQVAKLLDSSQTEVFNAGMGGSTIVDQLNFLEKALSLEPNLVVLVYSENDLDDLHAKPPMHAQLAHNRKLKSGTFGAFYGMVRDTCLFNLFLRARAFWRNWRSNARKESQSRQVGNSKVRTRLLFEYRRYFDRLKKVTEDSGAELLFVLFPSHHSIFDSPDLSTIPSVKSAVENRLVVDLTEILTSSNLDRRSLYLLPHDGHPTAKAYELAAERIVEVVKKRL